MIIASVDQIIIKHYFSPEIAGNYGVTFVLGRVIVMSSISLGVVIFTRSASLGKDSPKQILTLVKGILVISAISLTTMVATLVAPSIIVKLLAGSQYGFAKSYIAYVGIEMFLFGLIYIQTYFLISTDRMKVLWLLLAAVVLEISLLSLFHTSVQQVLVTLILVMFFLLISISGYTWSVLHGLRMVKTT
jgi:O-antigen/teichoic acid export membrane protein